MTVHTLKSDAAVFEAAFNGAKAAEVRKNDRDYKVGDILILQEIDGFSRTGRELRREITHIQTGYGLPEGIVVLSMSNEGPSLEADIKKLTIDIAEGEFNAEAWKNHKVLGSLAEQIDLALIIRSELEDAWKPEINNGPATNEQIKAALDQAERHGFYFDGAEGGSATGTYQQLVALLNEPRDMVLHCPECHTQHIDKPANCTVHDCHMHGVCFAEAHGQPKQCDRWDNPSHKSHLCAACGYVWRPCDQPTNGVERVKTRGKHDTPPKDTALPTDTPIVRSAMQMMDASYGAAHPTLPPGTDPYLQTK